MNKLHWGINESLPGTSQYLHFTSSQYEKGRFQTDSLKTHLSSKIKALLIKSQIRLIHCRDTRYFDFKIVHIPVLTHIHF